MNIYAFADEASALMEEQIVAMKRNGLKGIEIRNVDGTNISDISIEKAAEVYEKIKQAGLMVWSIGSPIGKIDIETDDFEVHLDKFRHTLEIAKVLDCKNIRLFSFYIPCGKNPYDYKNEVIRRLRLFVEIAKGTGIALCHENEKGIYGDRAMRCLEIYKEVPEFKGIFDPANFVQCGQDTKEAWKLLHPYIKYLHIKDAQEDGKVVPAGHGIGNLQYIMDSFRAHGGVDVSVEPHLSIFDGLQALELKEQVSRIDQFQYSDADTAFDVACHACKTLIR